MTHDRKTECVINYDRDRIVSNLLSISPGTNQHKSSEDVVNNI